MTPTESLGTSFWLWRSHQQPRSHDDIPRLVRPAGWIPDWAPQSVETYRLDIAEFERHLSEFGPSVDNAERVDRELLKSAFARVRWELDVLRIWQQQPRFYVDQTLGVIFDMLTPRDVGKSIIADVQRIFTATPAIIQTAQINLAGHAVAEFAQLTIAELADVTRQVEQVVTALLALDAADLSEHDGAKFRLAGEAAGHALAEFRDWLQMMLPKMATAVPLGRSAFQEFLTNVALLPYAPEELLEIGRLESDRAAYLEILQRNRNGQDTTAISPSFSTAAEQINAERDAEIEIRHFYVNNGLLSQPDSLRHYLSAPMPAYLEPIRWLGTADDLASSERLNSDGCGYVPELTNDLPYFYAANAHDPRAGIVHEGAHFQQLTLSWGHPRAIRRHYYDSGPNEGIAFYNEELMLASGLFDDSPTTRQIIFNFMRLRALRVEVDVRLALGELDIPEAGAYLQKMVPMDAATAKDEAAFFAASPGQGITYQIGKTEIIRLLSDAARATGEAFNLQAFHDRLWLEGNVPLSLQRLELLGDESDLERIEQLRTGPLPRS